MATMIEIQRICDEEAMTLIPEYVPGEENVIADQLSRTESSHGITLQLSQFHRIREWYGPLTIDAFATEKNTKLPRFFTILPSTKAIAVNALQQVVDSGERIYAFPPIKLIPQVLQWFHKNKAKGILVVPEWPTQTWWPCIIHRKFLPLGQALEQTPPAQQVPRGTTWRAVAMD